MATFQASVSMPRNRLLAALPPEDLARLWPRLEPVELALREIIQVPDEPITAVYFPESGWVSLIALLMDGNSAEVGIVGFEGMLGLPLQGLRMRSSELSHAIPYQPAGGHLRSSCARFLNHDKCARPD